MVTTHTPAPASTSDDEQVRGAACHMYDADMHIAHQSHVDAWVVGASAKLHGAIVEHLAATTAATTAAEHG